MSLSRARRREGADYWPGFVDALSTLLIGIVFLLSVFVLAQFFLSQEITGKDTALRRLENQLSELTDLLALERSQRRSVEESLGLLQSTLNRTEAERARIQGLLDGGTGAAAQASERAGQLQGALEAERQLSARAQSTVDILNQQITAMRRQLAALEEALSASEAKEKDAQTRIADLGGRLNVALAQRVQELARYRSDFFGRLRQILGTRQDIRVVGDRFVFQSEVFFDAGQAALKPEGQAELAKLATCSPTSRAKSRRTFPGSCASTATPTAARSAPRSSPPTGTSRRRAPSRWSSSWPRAACRPTASPPRASASSSRWSSARPTRPSAATAASSSRSRKGRLARRRGHAGPPPQPRDRRPLAC